MVKKDYTQDIKDMIDEKSDRKKVSTITDTFKWLQKKALPTADFKNDLFHKLECMHVLWKSREEPVKFSWFQFFWAFCSLIFVTGAVLFVFDSRDQNYDITLPDPTPEQEIFITHPELKAVMSQQNTDKKETILDINKEEKILLTESLVEVDSVAKQEVLSKLATTVSPRKEEVGSVNEWSTQINWSDSWDIEVSNQENPKMMLESSFSADMKVQTTEENFQDICEEYDGEYNSENMSCKLEEDRVCFEENFYACRNWVSEIDLDLLIEELIHQGGQ